MPDEKSEHPFVALWRATRGVKFVGSRDPSPETKPGAEWVTVPKPKRTRLVRFNPDTGTVTETIIEDEDGHEP